MLQQLRICVVAAATAAAAAVAEATWGAAAVFAAAASTLRVAEVYIHQRDLFAALRQCSSKRHCSINHMLQLCLCEGEFRAAAAAAAAAAATGCCSRRPQPQQLQQRGVDPPTHQRMH